jgi:hypothetical protein
VRYSEVWKNRGLSPVFPGFPGFSAVFARFSSVFARFSVPVFAAVVKAAPSGRWTLRDKAPRSALYLQR